MGASDGRGWLSQHYRRLVLDQKRVRIEGHLESQRKEIRELENAVKHLRFDMDRMNGALAKNEKKIELKNEKTIEKEDRAE